MWEYPFPPIFHCQNMVIPNDVWGEPDITPDLIGLNNALNLVQSNINRVLKIYGTPFLWGKGISESSIDRSPGKIIILPPTPDATIQAVAIQSDIANALVFADDLRSDMDELTRIPGIATGRIKSMPRGNLSGIAIELLFMPESAKTEEKRCTYGELIIDVCKALLVLARIKDDFDITLAWQAPTPHDDLQSMQAAVLKKQIGISDTTIQREQGYDPEEEYKLSQSEDERKVEAAQQAMMPQAPTPAQPPQGMAQQQQQSPFIGRNQ